MHNNIEQTYTSFQYVFFICLNAALGCFYWGYNNTLYNSISKNYEIIYNWPSNQYKYYDAVLTCLLQFGSIFGALFAGYISNFHSCRKCLMMTDCVAIIAMTASIIEQLPVVLFAKLFQGVCTGINCVFIGLYIREMSPKEISGKMGSLNQNLNNIGVLSSFVLGLWVPTQKQFIDDPTNNWWRFMSVFPCIVSLIRLLTFTFIFNFETPSYYMQQGKYHQAQVVLEKIYKPKYVHVIFEQLQKEFESKTIISFKNLLVFILN